MWFWYQMWFWYVWYLRFLIFNPDMKIFLIDSILAHPKFLQKFNRGFPPYLCFFSLFPFLPHPSLTSTLTYRRVNFISAVLFGGSRTQDLWSAGSVLYQPSYGKLIWGGPLWQSLTRSAGGSLGRGPNTSTNHAFGLKIGTRGFSGSLKPALVSDFTYFAF